MAPESCRVASVPIPVAANSSISLAVISARPLISDAEVMRTRLSAVVALARSTPPLTAPEAIWIVAVPPALLAKRSPASAVCTDPLPSVPAVRSIASTASIRALTTMPSAASIETVPPQSLHRQ